MRSTTTAMRMEKPPTCELDRLTSVSIRFIHLGSKLQSRRGETCNVSARFLGHCICVSRIFPYYLTCRSVYEFVRGNEAANRVRVLMIRLRAIRISLELT